MQVFLLALALLAVGVAGMAVTILVKKDGKFPDGEISHSKVLREKGVICAKEETQKKKKKRNPSAASAGKRPDACPSSGCDGCAFLEQEKAC